MKYSGKVKTKFDEDIIHDLRTTFKKLRALLRWTGIDKKKYKAFKKIYHAAGDLRNIQVALQTLKKERDTNHLLKWLSDRLLKIKKKWLKIHQQKILHQLKNRTSKLQVSVNKRNFFRENSNKIKHFLKRNTVSDEAVHEVRKLMKDMQYVFLWCREKSESRNVDFINISFTQLKRLNKKAGHYIDTCCVLMLLNEYKEEEKNKESVTKTNAIVRKINKNKSLYKRQLLSMLCKQI